MKRYTPPAFFTLEPEDIFINVNQISSFDSTNNIIKMANGDSFMIGNSRLKQLTDFLTRTDLWQGDCLHKQNYNFNYRNKKWNLFKALNYEGL
jgi:hypothetical protein